MSFENVKRIGKALTDVVANTAETGRHATASAKHAVGAVEKVTGTVEEAAGAAGKAVGAASKLIGATEGLIGSAEARAKAMEARAKAKQEIAQGESQYAEAIGKQQGIKKLANAKTKSLSQKIRNEGKLNLQQEKENQRFERAKSATKKVKEREALSLNQDEIKNKFKKQKLNIRASKNTAKLLNEDLKIKAMIRKTQKRHEQKEKQENQQEKYDFFINTEFLNILRKLKDKYKGDLKIDPKFWSETNRKRIFEIAKDGKTGGRVWLRFINYRKELLKTLKGDTSKDFLNKFIDKTIMYILGEQRNSVENEYLENIENLEQNGNQRVEKNLNNDPKANTNASAQNGNQQVAKNQNNDPNANTNASAQNGGKPRKTKTRKRGKTKKRTKTTRRTKKKM